MTSHLSSAINMYNRIYSKLLLSLEVFLLLSPLFIIFKRYVVLGIISVLLSVKINGNLLNIIHIKVERKSHHFLNSFDAIDFILCFSFLFCKLRELLTLCSPCFFNFFHDFCFVFFVGNL